MSSAVQCDDRPCFNRFENDIQKVFDKLCSQKNIPPVSVNIFKGNMHLKADYYIPLKADNLFQLNCDELLEMLRTLPYISHVEVDSKHNLTLSLRRHLVYKDALSEVSEKRNNYGMLKNDKTVFIVLDEEDEKELENLRNALLAEHIISILALNQFKVFFKKFDTIDRIDLLNCSELSCTNTCSLNAICQKLEEQVYISEWKTEAEINDNICMDSRKYIEDNNVVLRYDKALSTIILAKDNLQHDLLRTGNLKHFVKEHMTDLPDYIIHIASQGQNRNILKSGILLGMLEKIFIPQIYIFSQGVQYKGDTKVLAEQFIQDHKNEIELAMSQKYESFIPNDPTWAFRTKTLTSAAVKFDFLKMNQSSVLNLRSPSNRDGDKNFGIFVQYNYARLSAIFRSFQTKVDEGHYDPLPTLEDIDFTLLRLEEEWNLFNYILLFPKTVQGIIDSLLSNEKGKYRLNRICLMLQELCQNLSLYYSKIRILTGPQIHLQKTMFARLWLLRGIHQVFVNSFSLLNMQGLDQM